MTATVAEKIRTRLRVRSDLLTPDERRDLRIAAGLTQQEIGDTIGVTRNAIANYEAGTRTPQGVVRDRYAEALRALREAV